MKVAVTGATGTIGSRVVRLLRERGEEVTVLSRDAERARQTFGDGVEAVTWADPKLEPAPVEALAGRDGVIHLLGEAHRSTLERRRQSERSASRGRSPPRTWCAGSRRPTRTPRLLVSQSAEGLYKRGTEPIDENGPADPGAFLSDLVAAWEAEASKASELGLRVVLARTGVVLSPEGGALGTMLPFFKGGLGGPVAGGGQYVSSEYRLRRRRRRASSSASTAREPRDRST